VLARLSPFTVAVSFVVEAMKTTLVGMLLVVLLGLGSGCNKPVRQESSQPEVDPLNRVESAPKTASISLVHNTLKVADYTQFEFEVPAHSATPKLEGDFETLPKEETEGANKATVDFLVLTPEEFVGFKTGHGGTASYSITNAHAQAINYALPSTLDSSQKYYVVFRNRAGKSHPISVEADLTASF
jgi:hypothetical protein